MPGDAFRKVRPGEKLRIPAAAYNAFIDAAEAHQNRRASFGARGGDESPRVRIKNDSGAGVPMFGVLGIDSPLFSPVEALTSFKRGIVLRGVLPTIDHAARFVIATRPIQPGKIGGAEDDGLCIARVNFTGAETPPRVGAVPGVTGYLGASDQGGASIVWREPGVGVKWAVIRMGSSVASLFPVTLAVSDTVFGTDSTPTAHTYDLFDVGGATPLTPGPVDPGVEPHKWRRPSVGRFSIATAGLAYRDGAGTPILTWVNETLELDPCGGG